MNAQYFSPSYHQARQRFLSEASARGAELSAHTIAHGHDLTVDVAVIGPSQAPAVVITSGVHGVEGYLGSAIQLAWLHRLTNLPAGNLRYVFIHAVNPFGFAAGRRFNEDNVDLNRNFLTEASQYSGAPEKYQHLDPLLNPQRPARRVDGFMFKALLKVLRYGMPAVKEAVAGGQYDYPQGLFYGGRGPCESTRWIQDHIESWIGDAQQIIHLDFHSGLGRFADYRLLLIQPESDPDCEWYRDVFDASRVEPLADSDGVAYIASGAMGGWLRHRFANRSYRFVAPEFGTYGPLRVLAALRAENQAHFFHDPADQAYTTAKRRLLECFCPESQRWRATVVAAGLHVIEQAQRGAQFPCEAADG